MKRQLELIIEDRFKNSCLWKNKIEMDCLSQKVFFTIRENRIDLYHKGGLLFSFDQYGYKTHVKFAAVSHLNGIDGDYLTETTLPKHNLTSAFEPIYHRIKENCSKFSKHEALGVSEIYQKHSFLSVSNVVVLDIEASFESLLEEKYQDRIDLVLLNKSTMTLQFVEAKHFSNKEILSETTPKVLSQLERYESQILHRKKEIISEYGKLVRSLNRIFGLTLPEPIDFDPKVTLLIFGFDDDQKNGRLRKRVIENPQYKGIKVYAIGKIKDVKPENIWNKKEL